MDEIQRRIFDAEIAYLEQVTLHPPNIVAVCGAFEIGVRAAVRHPEWARAFDAAMSMLGEGMDDIDGVPVWIPAQAGGE